MSSVQEELPVEDMPSLKDIQSFEDDDDLFGDNHSDGSLFGDGDDAGSLFGDGDSDEMAIDLVDNAKDNEPRAVLVPTLSLPLPMPALQPLTRAGPGGLTLPSIGSDPHGALSRSHVGHTSDHQVVSNPNPSGNERGLLSLPNSGVQHPEAVVAGQAGYEQTIDTFAPNSHNHGDQAGHLLGEGAAPSSLDPVSDIEMSECDLADLERRLEHDLSQELGTTLNQDKDNKTNLGPPGNLMDEQQHLETLGLDKIGMTYPKNVAFPHPRLARQIDLDENGIKYLIPYVSLRRNDSCKLHFERLELTRDMGLIISKDLRAYVELSLEARPLMRKGTAGVDPIKRRGDYLRLSIGLLKKYGWGEKWFGRSSESGASRKLLWPDQSTLITLRFVGLVYKYIDQAKYGPSKTKKQEYRARAANTPAPSLCSIGSTESLAIDLTADDHDISQSLHILTPITSAAPSRPTSSHLPNQSQDYGLSDHSIESVSDCPNQTAPDSSSQPTPNTINQTALDTVNQPAPNSFSQPAPGAGNQPASTGLISPRLPQSSFPALQDHESPTSQALRILSQDQSKEDGTMAPPFNVTLAAGGGPLLRPINVSEGFTNIEQLAEHISGIKRRKNQPPGRQNKVDYRFFFVDKLDGVELCSPMTFNMGADMVQGDVVANLKVAFARAGDFILIYIYTPTGYKQIRDLEEWKEAVHEVWLRGGDGTSVNVAIHL